MDEDDGLPAVHFREQGFERRVAQVLLADARQQHDTIEPERVERVAKLLECAVDIGRSSRKRQRCGWSPTRRTEISLQRRASVRAAAASPKYTPGAAIDVMAVAIPTRSINESADSTLHFGNGMPPPSATPNAASALT
jgi:hypothetical protein